MRYSILLLFSLFACAADLATAPLPPIRLVLFGDSNTDYGFREPDLAIDQGSYVDPDPVYRVPADMPNSKWQLAGIIEEQSKIKVVNHGIGGTNTGVGYGPTGGHGPNARQSVNGVTRFEAEVLGKGAPNWSANGVVRGKAIIPTARDYAYISLGTNDCRYGLSYSETLINLRWMIETWKAQNLPASHLLITTIPPTPNSPCKTSEVNPQIRQLIASEGVTLIDLSAFASSDDGSTWRDPIFVVDPPNDVHYRYVVRKWLASEILSAIR